MSDLIAKSAATGYAIVTRNDDSAAELHAEAEKRGLLIPYPMTYKRFVDAGYDWRVPGVLIENTNDLLKHISRVPVLTDDGAGR